MNCEDTYQENTMYLWNKCQKVEQQWLKLSIKNQDLVRDYPSKSVHNGNYRAMGWSQSESLGTCPRSGRLTQESEQPETSRVDTTVHSIVTEEICAGCRHNGDGYGTTYYYCSGCGYLSWSSYDEA